MKIKNIAVPTVSVIIPTYNRAELLKRAIQSVLSQTMTYIEIIVVNDSPDEKPVLDVIKGFKDNRIHYFRNERKKGGNGARNTGLLKAKGHFIALLDDDDEWMPEKLEAQANRLQNLDSSWGGCYCGYRILEKETCIDILNSKEGTLQRDLLLSKISLKAGSTLMFKRSITARIGLFDEELKRYQDTHFLIKFLRYYKLAYVNQVLVMVNGHNLPKAKYVEEYSLLFLKKIQSDIESLKSRDQAYCFAFRYREIATQYAKEGNIKKTAYYLKKSIISHLVFPSRYILPMVGLIDALFLWSLSDRIEDIKVILKKNRITSKLLKRII